MNEELLHFLWKYQLFDTSQIQTKENQRVHILSNGTHNHLEGPDFLNAKLEIDNQLWAGNIEIHVKSSD